MTPELPPSQDDTAMVMMEFSFLTPEALGKDYEYVCAVAGLPPTAGGWGFVHCLQNGRRFTKVTDDVEYLRMIIEAQPMGALRGLDRPGETFPMAREGWPDEWPRQAGPPNRATRRRKQ